MIERYGNIWQYYKLPSYKVLITCSLDLKKNGEAYCARGTAAQAKHIDPRIPILLGGCINRIGRVDVGPDVWNLNDWMWAFPTKTKWDGVANIPLITDMMNRLARAAVRRPTSIFILPRPGCGNGRLKWVESGLSAAMNANLPNNVIVMTKKEQKDGA